MVTLEGGERSRWPPSSSRPTLADDVVGDYLNGAFSILHVVPARFDGVGAFTPIATQVPPIAPSHTPPTSAIDPSKAK